MSSTAPLNIALSYIKRGWNPVPIPFLAKGPIDSGWQFRVINEATAANFFNGQQQNIGVILGPTSRGLTDVDLDCPEAIKLAPQFLPPTGARFGRRSAPDSHWLYRTQLAEDSERAVIPFRDGKATIVELRIGGRNGAQTVFPGSVHESGEAIEWSKRGDPADVDGHNLRQRVAALASAVLILRKWPQAGTKLRHDTARVVGGFLGRCGWSADDAAAFVGAIAQASDNDDVKDRMRVASDAVAAFREGKHAPGFPAMAEAFGEQEAKRIADWLNYKTEDDRVGGDAPSSGTERPEVTIRAQPFVYRDPQTIPPRKWLYDQHFARGYVSADISPGGVGKTSLLLVEAIAMASSRNLIGALPPRPLTVWYVNLEDPLEEIERRIAAILLHYQIKPEEIEGRLYINSGRDTPLVVAEKHGDKTIVVRPVVDAISRELQERQVDLLLVDPFVNCHGVPENDNGSINLVAKTWVRLAEECTCAVGLIHHVRKPSNGQVEFTVDDARGGGALIGAVRSARVLNVMSKDEAAKAGIEERDRRLYVRVDDGKTNMKPPLDRAKWRKLESIGLGNSTADEPEDWVGVITSWTMPGVFDGVETADLRKVQAAIAGGEWAENPQAANWAGFAIADVMGWDAASKSSRQRIKTVLKTWIANKVLKVERRLSKRDGREKPFIVVGELA
jgi:hypothetical protein